MVPMAELAWRHRPSLAHPSHVSWPHRELHLRSQWRNSHGATAPFWHTPHASLSARPDWGSGPPVPRAFSRLSNSLASRRGRPTRVAGTLSGRPARVAGTPCCALPSASFACRVALPGGQSLARPQPASYSSPWSAQRTTCARCWDPWTPSGRPARVAGTPCCAAPAASDSGVRGQRGRQRREGPSWTV